VPGAGAAADLAAATGAIVMQWRRSRWPVSPPCGFAAPATRFATRQTRAVTELLRPEVIRPRVRLGEVVIVGPGKIELLRAVAVHGSISAAARSLGMGYKRAWSLLDELQRAFPTPLIEAAAGGRRGGGAAVTPVGLALLDHYDELERACREAAAPALAEIGSLLRR
jgi:molybdate transport system regulatory protein